LLLLSLLAVIVGCVFMYLEVQDYGENPLQGAPVVWAPAQPGINLPGFWPPSDSSLVCGDDALAFDPFHV